MKTDRLYSLDLFRGITMFLLVIEGSHLYSSLLKYGPQEGILHGLVLQFHHHPWNGLRFWDLIQPFFMFIVGVAMAFSLKKRWSKGQTWNQSFRHILVRCLVLLLFGVLLHCGYRGKLVWELWNVLCQLSFTILVSFLIIKFPFRFQLLFSFGLLLLTELLFRFTGIEGYDKPFVPDENFGSWMDLVLMGKLSGGHWVAINAIPTTAHTIWGVLAGKILQSQRPALDKFWRLLIPGLIFLAAGYTMDWSGLTPIIKRICTSSFVIASGGWCLVGLALCYYISDIKGYQKWGLIFVVVGMNPIFIYMFANTVGSQWFNGFMEIFTGGFLNWLGTSEGFIKITNALIVFSLEWYLCYWLYRKKIFIKI